MTGRDWTGLMTEARMRHWKIDKSQQWNWTIRTTTLHCTVRFRFQDQKTDSESQITLFTMDNILPTQVEARLAHIRRQKAHFAQLVELELEEQRLMALQGGAASVCIRSRLCRTHTDILDRDIFPHQATSCRPLRSPHRPAAWLQVPWTSLRRRQCSR